MVFHAQLVEPPEAQLREDASLVRDFAGQHMVKGADAVAGHHQYAVLPNALQDGFVGGLIEVAYLAGVDVGPAGKIQCFGGVAAVLSVFSHVRPLLSRWASNRWRRKEP